MSKYKASVYHSRILVDAQVLDEPVVLGRRDARQKDPPPVALHSGSKGLRLVIADTHQDSISRNSIQVVPGPPGEFVIRNLHEEHHVNVSHGVPLQPGAEQRHVSEVLLDFGEGIAVRLEPILAPSDAHQEYRTLGTIPPTPGADSDLHTARAIRQFAAPDAEDIAAMLRLALHVVQQAAGTDAFYQAAVVATTEIVDLDRTILLLQRGAPDAQRVPARVGLPDGWCAVAEHRRDAVELGAAAVSTSLLKRVMESGSTVVHDLRDPSAPAGSLQHVECAVASPILDPQRRVIGILYGDRRVQSVWSAKDAITDIEASLVEILAGTVAGGMARRAQERLRSTLAGFFSPKVVDLLASRPELMEGQDAEVSVLFCDVRGFSSVTEKLGPRKSIEWINDVMSELSQCVIDLDGVLVDYVGDELLAMWGAPGEQPDHALRAIDAARLMLAAIERLRTRWSDLLPLNFGAGIGANTGPARVGNVGSRQKFKYGPLGNTVNLGSRLQSATKQLGVACVAGEETVQSSGFRDQSRRIAKVSVVGIEQPISVYEIVREASDAWRELTQKYEQALSAFEQRRFDEAAGRLGAILAQHPEDQPSRKLLARAVAEMDAPSGDFTGVWSLSSK